MKSNAQVVELNEKCNTTTTASTTTTSSTVDRSTIDFLIKIYIETELPQMYKDCICRPVPPIIIKEITKNIKEAENPLDLMQIYRYALCETASAPRPSWAYARAIVNRCLREGYTPELF